MPDNNSKRSNHKQEMPRMHRRLSHFAEKQQPKNSQQTLTRLWGYLKQQGNSLLIVFILVVFATLGGLMGPFLMGKAIDTYISQGDLKGLASLLTIMLLVYLTTSFVTWAENYIMVGISQKTLQKIKSNLFMKMQDLSLQFFDKRSHGELMSRFTNDIENINATLSQSVIQLFSSILTFIGVIIMMFALNYQLAITTILIIPSITFLTRYISKYTRQGFREQQKNLGDLNGFIEESISGQKVVKIYCQEDKMNTRFLDINEKYRQSAIKAQIFANIMAPSMNMINNFSFALIAGVGGWLSIKNLITVGTIAAFLNYIRQFGRPLNQLATLYNSIQSALAGAERIFNIIDEKPEIQNKAKAIHLNKINGQVDFRNVSFAYDQDKPILKNINFSVKPGQMIALVGPTGAGKTTIVNLLTRFYDIDQGTIFIDNHDLRDLEVANLRSHLGIVLQDNFLFADTVKENIRYGRLDASDLEIANAARLANADHFIKHLPNGYDTKLNSEGSNLSQGQRQLLAIARTVLANPSILILDEATSNIDTRTEMYIQEAMLKLMQGRTSFVIAHRLSTIRSADQILVINNGQLIEQGTHDELLKQQGFYYSLHNSQFRDADLLTS